MWNGDAAHAFMDYCRRPEVGAANADASGYGTPNAAALMRQQHPVAHPSPEERSRLEYFEDLWSSDGDLGPAMDGGEGGLRPRDNRLAFD